MMRRQRQGEQMRKNGLETLGIGRFIIDKQSI